MSQSFLTQAVIYGEMTSRIVFKSRKYKNEHVRITACFSQLYCYANTFTVLIQEWLVILFFSFTSGNSLKEIADLPGVKGKTTDTAAESYFFSSLFLCFSPQVLWGKPFLFIKIG